MVPAILRSGYLYCSRILAFNTDNLFRIKLSIDEANWPTEHALNPTVHSASLRLSITGWRLGPDNSCQFL